jgi:translation initiation factor IF-3
MSRRFPSRPFPSREPAHRRNGKIRAREIRVLDETKQSLGIMPLGDALRLAQSKGLDLIEIAPTATPPVCRIMEHGKFLYEESKKKKESQARHPASQMKELQLTPGIDPHDFEVKLRHAIEFLSEEMKVRIKLRFRGRQKAHKEFGFEVVNRFVKEAAGYGQADAPPKMLGDRDLNVILSPLPREKRARLPAPPKPAPGADGPPEEGS